jgi:GDP-L-fucose synthase
MPASGLQQTVFVAGARGMVGSAIIRALARQGQRNVLAPPRTELDLLDGAAVHAYVRAHRPSQIYVAAAKVGGILANDRLPADFLYENLIIEANLIHAAFEARTDKLLFLGSTCIYPKHAPQPLKEAYLLSGPLEPTNEWYAVAKIAGIKLCQAYRRQHGCKFIAAMPTNLYGENDNFELESSHVMPALIRKFHDAKVRGDPTVTIWGTGTPRREFLHVDDCAEASLFLMANYDGEEIVNIGVGEDLSILELAQIIRRVVGFDGQLVFDPSKPDGTPRKLVDAARINAMGWRARIGLEEGIRRTYQWYRAQQR